MDQPVEIVAHAIFAAIEQREMQIGQRLSRSEKTDLINELVTQEILVREAAARGLY